MEPLTELLFPSAAHKELVLLGREVDGDGADGNLIQEGWDPFQRALK